MAENENPDRCAGELNPAGLLEDLAAEIMTVTAGDKQALSTCESKLIALKDALACSANKSVQRRVSELLERLSRLSSGSGVGSESELDQLRVELAALQDELVSPQVDTKPADQGPSAPAQDGFKTPDWVEESVFREFISSQKLGFEELETDMCALERGEGEARANLRRKVHTLKGEAGCLGLSAMEEVCHAIEDYLEADTVNPDPLFAVKDWLVEALRCYEANKLPDNASILARLRDSALEKPARENPEPNSESSANDIDHQKSSEAATASSGDTSLNWDGNMLEVFAEFYHESNDGLSKTDEILLAAEQNGVSDEQINALFRVFHTIKGVAGFLELGDITRLAHTTETMLDRARKGQLAIVGAVLDLLFDATDWMRQALINLRNATDRGVKPASDANLPELLARIEAATLGRILAEEPLAEAKPGDRLGEILSRPPHALEKESIERCLEQQKDTGRRLGEELIASDVAKPKQVAQALRAQNRAEERGVAAQGKLKEVVKVDLDRVDNLVSLIGEIVIIEAMVANAPELSRMASPHLRKHLGQMSKITRDLQDIGTRMRMVPVRAVFQKMERMVRDLARKNGKAISVRLAGEGTEMDRSMVEQINDPLVHMIRNAVDHGIETADERAQSGKPRQSTIWLRAFHQGASVVIQVADDGRGLNREAILAKAREKGLIKENENLTIQEIHNLILAPGFSTAKKITEISGRGVGMDVVRRNVEAIRGRLTIESEPGQGSTFTITLPLTLAIIEGMLVTCGQERYIIPTLSVLELLQPGEAMVFSVASKGELVKLREETFPLFRLDRLLGIPNAVQDPQRALVVVLESNGRKVGLLVDEVLTQQQVVIKSLGEGLPEIRCLSGAAIMPDGRVGLILNTNEIFGRVE